MPVENSDSEPGRIESIDSASTAVWRNAVINSVTAVASIIIIACLLGTWFFLSGPDLGRHLEALRIAGGVVFGLGGAVGLYLAAKRQQVLQRTLSQNRWITLVATQDRRADLEQRKLADQAQILDAEERRITELYTRAADQLGSDKVAIRLAGVYALERLAGSAPSQRQAIVNVLCAYLRMPPGAKGQNTEGDEGRFESEALGQEAEVRRSIEQVLADGLSDQEANSGWRALRVDLTGAHLNQLKLSGAELRTLILRNVDVAGDLLIQNCAISEKLDIGDSRYGSCSLEDCDLRAVDLNLNQLDVSGDLQFARVKFPAESEISNLKTSGGISFESCECSLLLWLSGGDHQGDSIFSECDLVILRMEGVYFHGGVKFLDNTLGGVRLQDVFTARWRTESSDLHPGFDLSEYDDKQMQVLARIPPYWVGPDGKPSRQLHE